MATLAATSSSLAPRPAWLKPALAAAALLAVIVLVVAVIRGFLADSGKPLKPTVHQIALLKQPPPPPPKPEEKKPEPEVKKEEIKIPEQQPEPQQAKDDAPPPGKDLGVDANATAGTDGFGLAARKGGRDLLASVGGTGTGNRFGWYSGVIQQQIQQALSKNKKLRGNEFRAMVSIWLGSDGRIQRAELSGSTGNADTDEALRVALSEVPPLREAPPADMPQPVRLRVTSRF